MAVTAYNTIFTHRDIRPSVRLELEADSGMSISAAGKRIQPDTSLHLTASRPPFRLKVEGRRKYKNVIRNLRN
ncbi:hypothetical protein M3625_07355 [Paenibacillus sp. MER 78]|nr:hypothetical protein [Paenibacillus sp. MER 78]